MTHRPASEPAGSDAAVVRAAARLLAGFTAFHAGFLALTARAAERFARRQWREGQQDAVARLDHYRQVVAETVATLQAELGPVAGQASFWGRVKRQLAAALAGREDGELVATFHNSVTRRFFAGEAVDPALDFVAADLAAVPQAPAATILRCYGPAADGELAELVARLLADLPLASLLAAPQRDAARVAARLVTALAAVGARPDGAQLEIAAPLFYRNKAAYVVGRLRHAGGALPLVLPLLHGPAGVVVDAVLCSERSLGALFSLSHSYFQLHCPRPSAVVALLRALLPAARQADLYIALGYDKHGKTLLYQDLQQHLAAADAVFVPAPGERGMVMVVFTLPSFPMVFKVIRDRFAYPKTTTRQQVLQSYRLVYRWDRAGRLVDAQEFEQLRFARHHFAPALLAELQQQAGSAVLVADEQVTLRHCYLEKRLMPLDLHLRQGTAEETRRATVDYGQAIRDLARTNIFPGDLLLKNFGVSGHGRVIFYDYDEICPLETCNFRRLPLPVDEAQEFGADPWFHVDEHDVFPEEFVRFLAFPPALRELFLQQHRDLLDVDFWREMQQRHRAGEVLDFYPYPPEERFGPA